VEELKVKLAELQPVLKEKRLEQEKLGLILEDETIEANKVKNQVASEKEVVQLNRETINLSKTEADRILSEAMPLLKSAAEALEGLTSGDIAEIKRNQKPLPTIVFALECVAIILEERTDMDSIRKFLSDAGFMGRLKSFKPESIKKDTQRKIKNKLASNPNFIPSEVQKTSKSAESLCFWIRAMVEFSEIWNEI
jgi:dynein heavy chain